MNGRDGSEPPMNTPRGECLAALMDPVWTQAFWDNFSQAEVKARAALADTYEAALKEGGCGCNDCVIRCVTEAIWPTLTAHVKSMMAPQATACGKSRGGPCGKA